MLDPAWLILNKNVTSIPTLIIHGVGIPIGFTFILMKGKNIYLHFFTISQNTFEFSRTQYIKAKESDQKRIIKDFLIFQKIL